MQTHFRKPCHRLALSAVTALASLFLPTASQAGDTFKWAVQYIVDNSQSVAGESQKAWPRGTRGLALSPDGRFLYAGYLHGRNGTGEVRKIAVGETEDYGKSTVKTLSIPFPKSIACDDKGRVYIASAAEVIVYDGNLSQLLATIQVSTTEGVTCEGVALAREGNDLALYCANRNAATIHRFIIEEKDGQITGSKAAGFDGSGVMTIPKGADLRGIEIDSKGRIWAADHEGNRVYIVSKDGKDIKEITIPSPIDIAIEGNRAYVSRSVERQVAVVEADSLSVLGNLAVPWDELELTPTGNSRHGALSGIVSIPGKGFFVTNESGQTAHQKSTYGKVDANSDKIGSRVYRDALMDDNDPILRALEVKE